MAYGQFGFPRRRPVGFTDPSDATRSFGPVDPSDASRLENFNRVLGPNGVREAVQAQGTRMQQAPMPPGHAYGLFGSPSRMGQFGQGPVASAPQGGLTDVLRMRRQRRSGNRFQALGL